MTGAVPCLVLAAVLLALAPVRALERVGAAAKEPSVTLIAVGDVLLDRGVGKRIAQHGVGWPFGKVKDTIRSANVAFCNLECPLSADGIKVNKPIAFKANPATVRCLTDAGFDIVSLANNHVLDCSRPGLIDTMECLKKHRIAYAGAGPTPADAALPTILSVNGVRIAFLARNAWLPECVWLRPDAPGIAGLEPDSIESEVRAAKAQADVVIVSLHWGIEYRKHPQHEQVELARRLIDAGASLVVGHHPHVVQPVEKYHGGVIAYSLGNFVFDSPFKECKTSAILKCRLSKAGISNLELIPVSITDYRPALGKRWSSRSI